jgi:hypothetical protein
MSEMSQKYEMKLSRTSVFIAEMVLYLRATLHACEHRLLKDISYITLPLMLG